MIKLFGQTDKVFNSNGDLVIKPLKAKVYKKDNADYYLDLDVGLEYADYMLEGNIVVADTPQGSQAFRINNVIKTKSKISTKAWHVFYDSENYLIEDSNVVDKNCNDALNHLNLATEPQSPFVVSSNVVSINSYRCIRKSLYEAIKSVIDYWGGHLVRNNYNIEIKNDIGVDNGVTIEYRKNLKDITCEENWNDVVTKLLPTGRDGIMLNSLNPLVNPYITSQVQYSIPYTKTVSFSQDGVNEDDYKDSEGNLDENAFKEALIEDLRDQAIEYVNQNCIPKVNYSLKANVDKITDIGDIIEVKDRRLGVNILTSVISFTYDCLLNKYIEIQFGNFKNTLSNLIPSITSSIDKSFNQQTQNVADMINKSIEDATNDLWNAIDNQSSSAENSTTYNITGSGTYPRIMKYSDSKLYVWLDDRYRVIENGEVSNTSSYFTHREGSSSGVYNGESDETHTITDIANAFGILSPNNDGRVVVFFRCHGTRKVVVDGNTITIPYYSIRAKVSDTNGVFNDYSGQSTVMWSTEIDEDTRNNMYIENNKLMCEYYSSGGTISVWEPWAETGINYVVFSKIRHNTNEKLFPINCEAYPFNYTDTCQDIYKQPYVVTGGSIARKSGVTLSYVIHGYTQANMDGVVNPKSRVGMISFAKLKDGSNKHIAVVEDSVNLTASQPRPMCVQYLYANEMTTGTWSPSSTLKTLFMPDVGERRGAPFVTTLADGRVAISFMSSQEFKGIKRTDGATENNRVIDIFVSKVPITYNMTLTDDLFVKLNFFEFSTSQWGKWGAVQDIEGILYKLFTYGINTSENTSTKYGNVIIFNK